MNKYSMPEWLLLIDPGKTSGVGVIDCHSEPDIVWSDEMTYMDTAKTVHQLCADYGSSLRVVCESFVITPMTAKNSVAPWSLELIGVIKYFTELYGCELVMQTPQKAKNFCPNPRLKAVGFWHRGGDGHARDALRHGVTHLVECGWTPEKLLEN